MLIDGFLPERRFTPAGLQPLDGIAGGVPDARKACPGLLWVDDFWRGGAVGWRCRIHASIVEHDGVFSAKHAA